MSSALTSCPLYLKWVIYFHHNSLCNCQLKQQAMNQPCLLQRLHFPQTSSHSDLIWLDFVLPMTMAFWCFWSPFFSLLTFHNWIYNDCVSPYRILVGTSCFFPFQFVPVDTKSNLKFMGSSLVRASQTLYSLFVRETLKYHSFYATLLVYFNTWKRKKKAGVDLFLVFLVHSCVVVYCFPSQNNIIYIMWLRICCY